MPPGNRCTNEKPTGPGRIAAVAGDRHGVEPAPEVRRVAMYSKRNLKRINNPRDLMAMPYSLMARRNRYNIYAGNF